MTDTPAMPDAAPDTTPGTLDTTPDSLTPRMRLFLEGVAGPESAGKYDVRYGGADGPQTFTGYGSHPNIATPIPGTALTSTASGKFQFLNSTWQPIAAKLGLKDFSPDSQDRGAAYLASSTYRHATGRDLETDLQDPSKFSGISTALHGQWPTLTGKNISVAMAAPSAAPPAPMMVANAPTAPAPAPAPAPAQSDPLAQLRMMNQLQMLSQLLPGQQKAAGTAPVYNPGGNTAAILQAGNIGQPATSPMQTMMMLARMRNPLYG